MYLFSMSICSKESFDHVLRWFLLLLTFSPILSFLNVLLSLSFSGELKLELVRLGSRAHWTLRPRHVRHFALNRSRRCLHSLNPFRIEVLKESTFILRELLGEDDLEREGYEQKWQPAEIGKGSFSLLPLSSQIPLSCSMSLSVSALVLAGCLQAPDLPPPPPFLLPPSSLSPTPFLIPLFPELWWGIPIGADGSAMVHAFQLQNTKQRGEESCVKEER